MTFAPAESGQLRIDVLRRASTVKRAAPRVRMCARVLDGTAQPFFLFSSFLLAFLQRDPARFA